MAGYSGGWERSGAGSGGKDPCQAKRSGVTVLLERVSVRSVRLGKEYFFNPPKQRVQLSTNKIVTVTSNDCLIFLLASYLTLLPHQT